MLILPLKRRWDTRYKTTSAFTCCTDVQVYPVTSLVGVVTGGQQSSHSHLWTFIHCLLLCSVLKFFLFPSMLNYMLFVFKEQYMRILVKTFRNSTIDRMWRYNSVGVVSNTSMSQTTFSLTWCQETTICYRWRGPLSSELLDRPIYRPSEQICVFWLMTNTTVKKWKQV